jgi:hypothetical protein
MILSDDGKSCITPEYSGRQFIQLNGESSLCPDFQIVSEDLISCYEPTCGPREKVIEDGTCQPCSSYENQAKSSTKSCELPTCGPLERI